ncbi:uncharacterized protein MELLADRAFT_84465 [Melampsora larici-populina 98AG31]|uniref:Uncharacterized protein n=1 Tax=Melampsora larici-populina (strain 98AG31 / pathotype 3-4-7) TaxID=747676 RepID=F4SC32_MELLP|nr:uncharacterized protein MELLADRAFT_84465 [Melampsora larici-populina 98AG31]EGF97780.1 hypothetical protein MELLADRAFT_84465 [Melampsora larici-populina 98AG31]
MIIIYPGEGARKGHANPWIRFLAFCPLALEVEYPFFFALANLPDLSNIPGIEDEPIENEDEVNLQHLDDSISAPPVHQLTHEERQKYQPLFDELVNVEKLHLCHGQPSPTSSVATLQKRSLVELCKAHHAFAVVCQRFQITYYLAGVSCGSTEGWTQVFSNNTSFATWASSDDVKVPQTLASYIHGQSAAKKVEGSKPQQPSDERKTRLGRELNILYRALMKEGTFPKCEDPEGELKSGNLLIRIVQKPGSNLSKSELEAGHCLARSSTVKSWLRDIKEGYFLLESIPESEREPIPARRPKSKKSTKTKNTNIQPSNHPTNNGSTSQNQNNNTGSQSTDEVQLTEELTHQLTRDRINTNHNSESQPEQATSRTLAPEASSNTNQTNSGLKRKLQALAKGSVQNQEVKKKKRKIKATADNDKDNDSSTEEEDSSTEEEDSSTEEEDSSTEEDSNSDL